MHTARLVGLAVSLLLLTILISMDRAPRPRGLAPVDPPAAVGPPERRPPARTSPAASRQTERVIPGAEPSRPARRGPARPSPEQPFEQTLIADPEGLERFGQRQADALSRLAPKNVVLRTVVAPPLTQMILAERIAQGLRQDRVGWEAAIVDAAKASSDTAALEVISALGLRHLRSPWERGRLARVLIARETTDRLLSLAGQLADGDARDAVRRHLWAHCGRRGAVVGLGHVVRLKNAERLAALSDRVAVRQALQRAQQRTGHARFGELRKILD